MGLTSSRTIIPVKEAQVKLGRPTLIKVEKVSEHSEYPSFDFRSPGMRPALSAYEEDIPTTHLTLSL